MIELQELAGTYPLPEAEVEAFRRTGHFLARGLFTPEEIAVYRPVFRDYVMEKREALSPGERTMGASLTKTVFSLAEAPKAVVDFVTSPRLGEIAARLMGVDAVRILHFCGFFKPGGGPATPWHQDLPFVPLDSDLVLSLWIPLVDTTADMGTLVFAEGSHLEGQVDPAAASRRFPLVPDGDLQAGDASIHMAWIAHASLANASERMREAVAICLYADGARVRRGGRTPFEQTILDGYFHGLRPGDLAAGPMNPVVFPRPAAVGEPA
jgi:hypothetical protein